MVVASKKGPRVLKVARAVRWSRKHEDGEEREALPKGRDLKAGAGTARAVLPPDDVMDVYLHGKMGHLSNQDAQGKHSHHRHQHRSSKKGSKRRSVATTTNGEDDNGDDEGNDDGDRHHRKKKKARITEGG